MTEPTRAVGYPDPIRHPHEILLGATCKIVGILGLVFPETISPGLRSAFPGDLVKWWFVGLILSGGLILFGIFTEGILGPLMERIGLGVSAAFFLAYIVAVLSNSGMRGLTATTLPMAYTIANVVRMFQITSALRRWSRHEL